MSLKKTKLGDVCEVSWGDTSVTKSSYVDQGYPAYSASGCDGFLPYFDHDGPGIVLSAIGAQCGKTWFAQGKWSCIKNTIFIKSTSDESDIQYLAYLVADSKIWPKRGAAQPFISQTDARNVVVELPPLQVQKRVVELLSAYDELIENSQRRIKILESMARALYREWFVHFRFPGHESVPLVPSSIGDIPMAWEVTNVGKICENFDRLRKPISKMKRAEMQGEYPYYGAAKVFDHVNDFIFDGEYLLMAEDGSVMTTERKPVLQLVNEKFWPNNHTHVLRGITPVSTLFLFLALSEVDISPYITGAAQPKITQENMNRIPLVRGTLPVHEKFDRYVEPIFRESQLLSRQMRILRDTRDLLLPRLMSGQIDVAMVNS